MTTAGNTKAIHKLSGIIKATQNLKIYVHISKQEQYKNVWHHSGEGGARWDGVAMLLSHSAWVTRPQCLSSLFYMCTRESSNARLMKLTCSHAFSNMLNKVGQRTQAVLGSHAPCHSHSSTGTLDGKQIPIFFTMGVLKIIIIYTLLGDWQKILGM